MKTVDVGFGVALGALSAYLAARALGRSQLSWTATGALLGAAAGALWPN